MSAYRLWILDFEAKRTEFSAEMAIAQCLAYMASPPDRSLFGMVTNGGEFIFIKLSRAATPEYDISDVFSLLPRRNRLYDVLALLKRLGQLSL
ncbi:MAG: hypothetical protein F6J93_09680 [Oscillatoria sp. SIO1A7]|nr:hypothetical protein [Oscillatoria sp. SIO1A7]